MADNFDYQSQQQAIQYQQALAKQLQSTKAPEGQMISGRYVSPSKLGVWGAALQNGVGGYLSGKALADQQDLNRSDRQAYADGMKKLMDSQDPSNFTDAAKAASPMPQASYMYKDPSAVGPTMDQLNGVSSTPVGQASMPTQNLPPMAPPQQASMPPPPPVLPPQLPPQASQPTPQQIEQRSQAPVAPVDPNQINPGPDVGGMAVRALKKVFTPLDFASAFAGTQPQTGGATGSWADGAPAAAAATPPQSSLPQAIAAQTPAPTAPVAPVVAPSTPAPDTSAASAPTAPAVAPTQAQQVAQDFNVMQPSQSSQLAAADGQASFLKNAMSAQRDAGMQQLSGTKDGQVLVNALHTQQLQNALAPKYETKAVKNADGSETLVRTPTTGVGAATPIYQSTGAPKVLETKDTPTGVVERTAAGWRPAVDTTTGLPVVSTATASDQRASVEQGVKMDQAKASNQQALGVLDSANTRLDRISQLYKVVATGPIAGNLPNWTANRQELQGLLSQELFNEVTDSLSGASASGGAPKMNRSEFEFLKNNGGLNMNTGNDAAQNMIAQMRIRLNANTHAIQQFGQNLGARSQATPVPGVTGVPARGQTFNGPNAAAASALGLN